MRLLLDTQILIWAGATTRPIGAIGAALLQPDVTGVCSSVSTFEIATKHLIGRLDLPDPPLIYVRRLQRTMALESIDVTHEHAAGVDDLPLHHRDPFDRLLIAQARLEGCVLASTDDAFDDYDVELLRP